MDSALFKKIIYNASKQLGFNVVGCMEPEVTPNFYAAEIELNYERLFILASYENDWSFSSQFNSMECQLDFVDCPTLAALLQHQYGVDVLTKDELHAPFEDRSYLLESDVRYWQPKTLGEGLFNWWD